MVIGYYCNHPLQIIKYLIDTRNNHHVNMLRSLFLGVLFINYLSLGEREKLPLKTVSF